ncbi:MAG: AMP-binding protein [bacterium]
MILHHEFVKIAKKMGKKLAIIDRTTDKRVPYSKALIAAILLARKFNKYEKGYLGIMIPNSAGSFLAILGALLAGKVPVMINYSTGAEKNAVYAQDKCGFKKIITSKALLEKIKCPKIEGMIYIEDIMESITKFDKIKALFRSKLSVKKICKSTAKLTEDYNAVILFTSGSEKEPKAVQLTHKNLASNALTAIEIFKLTPEDSILCILPLFHVFGHMVNFWLPLLLGSTAITYANPLDFKTIPKIIKEEKPVMIAATPVFFAGYLRESRPGDFDSLRILVAGADKTPDRLRKGYKEKHNKLLLEGYGTTETSPVISVNTLEHNRAGSIGKVFPDQNVKIVDIESGTELPPNKEGKILVKGPNVMKGYFDDIEETSLRIKDGWYDTGDMGMLDEDGYLWHKGRLKRFVKIGGEMVSLVNTESILNTALPDHIDCCVVEVPHPTKGAQLIAAVSEKINRKEILKKLGKELPKIAIPKIFMVFPELPKMGSGKLDFRTITEMVKERQK